MNLQLVSNQRSLSPEDQKELIRKRQWKLNYIKELEENGFYIVKGIAELPDLIVGTIVKMPIEFLRRDENQARIFFDQKKLEELRDSILLKGDVNKVLDIFIEKDEQTGEYFGRLIGGERRWRSCGMAKLSMVSCVIKPPLNKKNLYIESAVDNIGKEPLSPIEEALVVQRFESYGWKIEYIAKRLAKSVATVLKIKRYLNLTPECQEMLISEKITRAEAISISKWHKDDQKKVFGILEGIKRDRGKQRIHQNELDLLVKRSAEKQGLKKADEKKIKRGKKEDSTINLLTRKIARGIEDFRNLIGLARQLTEENFSESSIHVTDIIKDLEATKENINEVLKQLNEWA